MHREIRFGRGDRDVEDVAPTSANVPSAIPEVFTGVIDTTFKTPPGMMPPVTVPPIAYVNWSAVLIALVPIGVVTVTLTIPAVVVAGAIAVIEPSLLTTTPVAGVDPKRTLVAPVKPTPASVTDVPPAMEPVAGATSVTAGETGVALAEVVNCMTAPGIQVPPTLVQAAK